MTGSWRLECWSNPRLGTSTFVTEIPFTRATLADRDDSIATSSVEIPAHETVVIDAIIRIDPITRTSSTANIVRAFYVPGSGADPTLPALEFWATDIDYIIAEDATVTAKVFGPHIKGGVDEARILPFDYPANPPAEEDWRYGGSPVTLDGWFEATSSTSMVVEVTIDDTVTGGTWTYTTPGDTTAALDWDEDPVAVDSQITLLSDVAAVDVTRSGDGTTDNPYVFRITHRDPVTFATDPTADGSSLTGGGLTLAIAQQGGLDPSPWTPSTNMVTGERFGSYAGDDGSNNFGGFYVDDLDPFEGDFCLFVNGLSQFAGNQRVYTGLTPGARYRFDAYCKPTNPGVEPYRLTVKDVDESYFVFGRDIIAASGWNLHDSVEWIQPEQRTTAVIRFAYTGTGNPDPYRFEGALYEGAPSATVGVIVDDLLTDLKTGHSPRSRLGWVDLDGTVSATVDSSGATWSGSVSVNLRAWDRLGSDILGGDLARLGVEWNVEATSLTAWELKIWDVGNRGTDRTSGADPAFTVGAAGFAGGRSAARRQQFTVGIGRAPDGTFVEVDDTDGITAFGTIDGLVEADALTPDSITAAVDQALAEVQSNAYSLQTSSGPGGPVPFVDVFIGDTVNFYIPALDAVHARRLHSLTVTVEADTWSAAVVGSRTYAGMSAVAEQLRRLSNPRRRRPGDPDGGVGSVGPPAPGGAGDLPYVVIVGAAVTDPTALSVADFIDDGAGDGVVIQQAIDAAESSGLPILVIGAIEFDYDGAPGGGSLASATGVTFQGLGPRLSAIINNRTGSSVVFNRSCLDLEGCTIANMSLASNAEILLSGRLANRANPNRLIDVVFDDRWLTNGSDGVLYQALPTGDLNGTLYVDGLEIRNADGPSKISRGGSGNCGDLVARNLRFINNDCPPPIAWQVANTGLHAVVDIDGAFLADSTLAIVSGTGSVNVPDATVRIGNVTIGNLNIDDQSVITSNVNGTLIHDVAAANWSAYSDYPLILLEQAHDAVVDGLTIEGATSAGSGSTRRAVQITNSRRVTVRGKVRSVGALAQVVNVDGTVADLFPRIVIEHDGTAAALVTISSSTSVAAVAAQSHRGTATVTSGNTSVVVTHNLGITPAAVIVTAAGDPAGRVWVSAVGASTFTINTSAAVAADTVFYFRAEA